MGKTKTAFLFETDLLDEFRRVAKERGHTMTWYLEGCMRQVVEGRRRKEVKRGKKRSEPVGSSSRRSPWRRRRGLRIAR